MTDACCQFAERGVDLVLLFTEEPDLYRRFGFELVPQHAFSGRAPETVAGTVARTLTFADDIALIDRLLAARAPVSSQIALVDAPSLFLDRLQADNAVSLAFLPDPQALVVYEGRDDALTLVDVVAEVMPTLAEILGAFTRSYTRVTTLFPPDRLAWASAQPILEDNGLMVRGTLPKDMRLPFMLPPTAEF